MFDRRDSYPTRELAHPHLDGPTLARLASGVPSSSDEERHLAGCRECFTAYAELVRCRDESDLRGLEAPPELLRLGRLTVDRMIAADARAGSTTEETPIPAPRRRRTWAMVPGLAVAALLLFLVVRGPAPSALPEAEYLDPVRDALILQSSSGLVNPLVAEADLSVAPTLRGVDARPLNTAGGELRLSITELRRAHQDSPESAEVVVWLVSALQVDGQLRSARAYLEPALDRHPTDSDLAMLEIEQLYREGDSAGALQGLEARLAAHPDDELARRNLAKLQALPQ